MSDIPPDIINDILIQLPVKSLLRFRCVSKSWRSLIDSKHFIKLHLRHSFKTSSNRTLLMDSAQLYYIDLDSFERLDVSNAHFEPHHVAGSCNGLVLVVSNAYNIVLWNPSTRKVNKLPMTPIERFDYDSREVYFALGYDSKHDDYKVVRIAQAPDSVLFSSETKIYSLKTNSWKMVDDFPYVLACRGIKWAIYLNDALHIVKQGLNSQAIVAFELGKEEYYEVPKPEFSGASRGLSLVEALEGCLAVVVSGEKNSSEIWLMKEYGVKESWTKLLCFVPRISVAYMELCPFAYSKSGDEVLLNYDGVCLYWYNLRKKTVTIPRVIGLSALFGTKPLDPPFYAEVCVGSLVSPYSPAGMATEKQQDRQGKTGKEIKKKRDDFHSVGFKLVL